MFAIRSIPPYRLEKRDFRFILTLVVPALIEYIISHLFTMVDTIMLGNTPESARAIAAVGMCGVPLNIVIDVLAALTVGTTAAVAFYTGSGEKEKARSAARQSLVLFSAIGLAVTVLALFMAGPVIRFAGAREDTFAEAVAYYRICAAGFLLMTATFAVSASLRGAGQTKLPMIYSLLSAALNVFLNYCLIYGNLGFPEMGVRGAALATTISKVPALLIALGFFFLGRTPVSCRRGDSFRPDKQILGRILKIGIPAALEQVILQTGALLSNKIIATIPTDDYAAFQVSHSLDSMSWQFAGACAVASTTAAGQMLGEGRPDKARSMIRAVFFLSIILTGGVAVLYILCGKPLAGIYTHEGMIADRAAGLLRIAAAGMMGISVHVPIAGALRAAGDTGTPLIASFISLWIFRVGVGYLLVIVLNLGAEGACLSCALDQVVRALIIFFRYLGGRWARFANRHEDPAPQRT